jgi:hypothetical protein
MEKIANYTLAQFVKDWLPDYGNRVKEAMEYEQEHFSPEFRTLDSFYEYNFPEAIQAFAKAQRYLCAERFCNLRCNRVLLCDYPNVRCKQYDNVISAPMPTSNNTKNE